MKYEVAENTTLLPFLLSVKSGRSRTSVKSSLAHSQVSVNGCRVTRHDTPLAPGDVVEVSSGKTAPSLRHPLLRIVYEDDSLIVVDKHEGLLSVGTDKEQRKTAFYILSEHIKRSDPAARLFVIHRLDRETSGLMMFAKSTEVQEKMQRNWKSAVVDRRYVAVTEGVPVPAEGTVTTYLREDRNLKMWACRTGEDTPAVTGYRTLRTGGRYSLVELRLSTGRKNQIRAHMEWLKTPIAGDKKYGATTSPAGRVCLHACRLCFIHPVTGEQLDFSTGIPRTFQNVIDGLPAAGPGRNSGPRRQ